MRLIDAIINPWSINIFSDASTTSKNRNQTTVDACYGAVAYEGHNKVNEIFRVLRNTTSNHAELRGINLAVRVALEMRDSHPYLNNFNIFSDSMISVFGISGYCKKWVNLDNAIYGMSPSPHLIASQEVYVDTLRLIVDNSLKVTIWHQKGHVNTNNMESIDNALDVFKRNNNFSSIADIELIKYISDKNNEVDKKSREILYRDRYSARDFVEPVYFIPYKFEQLVKDYAELQRKGENLC